MAIIRVCVSVCMCDSVCVSVCLSIRTIKPKRLKIQSPNLPLSITSPRPPINIRSKGQRSRLQGHKSAKTYFRLSNQNSWNYNTNLATGIVHHESSYLFILGQQVKGQGHRVRKCKNILKAIEWPAWILVVCTLSSAQPLVIIIFCARRLKIKQLRLDIWLSLRFERARKRDCICLLDGNRKTLKEVNGLEWITRDSCCASANFMGQLNGLSIPCTRSFNDKRYENVSRRKIGIFSWLSCCCMIGCSSGSDWSAIDVRVCISVRDSDIPCQRFASGPGYLSGLWPHPDACHACIIIIIIIIFTLGSIDPEG